MTAGTPRRRSDRGAARPRALARGSLIFLRFPARADRGEWLALRRRNRRHLERWEPAPPGGRRTLAPRDFARVLRGSNTPTRKRLFICRAADGAIVGQIGVSQIIRGPLQQAFVGYWLGREHTGKGYMTEALGLVVAYAFGRLRLHRLECNMQPNNGSSRAVARRAGFRREGYSPRYLKIAGAWRDHERWAMTAEEWRARRA